MVVMAFTSPQDSGDSSSRKTYFSSGGKLLAGSPVMAPSFAKVIFNGRCAAVVIWECQKLYGRTPGQA